MRLRTQETWDLNEALEGQEAWEESCRARGVEARGILPCKNYIRCHGRDYALRES